MPARSLTCEGLGRTPLNVNVIQGINAAETWLKATRFIVENGRKQGELSKEVINLVSVTHNPLEIFEEVDTLFRKHIGTKWIAKGSDCIFPVGAAKYRKNTCRLWSKTYWGRLTRYREKIDQLEFIVHRMERKPHSKQLSCVTFDPESDIQPHRPFNPSMPCLIALDFKFQGEKINIFAMFRSHDFGRKAYGNYIGLGMLLKMVSQKTGYPTGEIVCYSVSAHIRSKEFPSVNALLEEYGACNSFSPKKVERGTILETYSHS